jgi:hypothetical protein
MVLTAYFVLSPVTGLFVTVVSEMIFANLMPASGHQDHTTSPSTGLRPRQSAARVHRIPAQRP